MPKHSLFVHKIFLGAVNSDTTKEFMSHLKVNRAQNQLHKKGGTVYLVGKKAAAGVQQNGVTQ